MSNKILVFDTTLRDGEQSPGVNLNKLEKLEIAKQLERFGVNVMEAGFPASSQGDFEAVRNIAQTVRNVSIAGLARATVSDIDITWEALKEAEAPRLHVFLATSPIHMTYKLKKSPEQVMELAVNMVRHGASKFPYVEWSAEDASRSDLDFLVRIIEKVIDAGAKVINLPDTVGYATPEDYGRMFRYVKEHVPNIDKAILSAHCHNDLGMAIANSMAAIENGATQVEGTINGIGERAGNAALEEFAVALAIRNDKYPFSTSLELKEIKRTSDLVRKLTGMAIAPNKAVVGQNAFAHESGIHQDGVLKHAQTYEIITPSMVGIQSNDLVLGKHSGRHAFKDKIEQLGFDLTEEKIEEAFKDFKSLTDKKKEVTEEDLLTILTEIQTSIADLKKYDLLAYQVQSGSINLPTATVALRTPEGIRVETARTGKGPVEALFNTLEELIKEKIHLTRYHLNSVGQGRDALAEVHVKMTVNGIPVSGRGSSQDVLEASARAFLNAVNRVFYNKNYKVMETVNS
ncbi:2-isopropylmalate synthase [Bacillus sp. FJAT-27225]|uniref:2-isopropylmalate synthase n=1 Tax=Bacillus sp. FJAT-27225 TaxID=1743144 RepID=UPI00080C29DF|nr:2-isopropylmalate synthase [Bacillus sp. FJAT-27225]OCA83259.1 2-isopropylmalate synthase [Bacillus sp. FJAT-27225]